MRTRLLRGIILTLIISLSALALNACGGKKTSSVPVPGAEPADGAGSSKTVLAKPGKPVSVPGAFPTEGGVPLLAHLFDDGSHDPDGEIVKWEWNFGGPGDGHGSWQDYTETQGDAWHTYTHPGTAVAHLRVTDNDGDTDVAFVKIRLGRDLNAPPVAVANADPMEGYVPLTVSFTAEGSYDPDGTIVKYEWDFGDGAGWEDFTETGGIAEFTYTTASSYIATLRITDDDSAIDTAILQIEVHFAEHTWPMFHRDMQHSGLASIAGPQNPAIKWVLDVGGVFHRSPVIANDGTLYVNGDMVYAVTEEGTVKWSFPVGTPSPSPAISGDGTVYVASETLYALNPNGSAKWTYSVGSRVLSSPTIGDDGTVYVADYSAKLHAIGPDGQAQWVYQMQVPTGVDQSSPAIGTNGMILVGSDDLVAVDPDGNLLWQRDFGPIVEASPTIAPDGTIYTCSWYDDSIRAFAPDGAQRWIYFTGWNNRSTPALASDGTMYTLSDDGHLYALSPEGSLVWKTMVDGADWHLSYASPVVDALGDIYVGVKSGDFYKLGSDGSIKWKLNLGSWIASSPAIGSDGTVYITTYDGKLYAIGEEPPAPSWHIETIDGEGIDAGLSPSLAFDPDGFPAISYHTWTPAFDVKYAHWNGSVWDIDLVEDRPTNADAYGGTSLAFNSLCEPTISYLHHVIPQWFNGKVWFATGSGDSWSLEMIPDNDAVGQYSSLKYDSSGHPLIAYHQFISYSGGVKLARWNGAAWLIEHVDSSPGEVGGVYTSMALDSSDSPHISYGAGSGDYGGGQLRYANWNGNGWDVYVIDSGIGARWPLTSIFTSIALDSTQHPRIAYRDAITQDLKYASYDGTSWTTETIESAGDTGWWCSLAMDAANTPYISYHDFTNHAVKLAKAGVPGDWEIEVIESNLGSTNPDIGFTSLSLDPASNPAVAYYHEGDTDLKLAWYY